MQLLGSLKFFFADTVFVHQFVQLAAAYTGMPGRDINFALVTCQDILQMIPFNFRNTLLSHFRQRKLRTGRNKYRSGFGFESSEFTPRLQKEPNFD